MDPKKSEEKKDALQIKENDLSVRFTTMVTERFTKSIGTTSLSPYQERLIQNYFVSLDLNLKNNEAKRNSKYNDLPMIWNNVNMEQLAIDVVSYAKQSLDPAMKNHINMILYKNSKTIKYDVGFLVGYEGKYIQMDKFGVDSVKPDIIKTRLVYSNDKFTILLNEIDGREDCIHEVPTPFNRGEVIGGYNKFIYHKEPFKNRVDIMDLKAIEKRRPKTAAAEFWGGEKDVWENGKKTGKKEAVAGWFDEMCWKTVRRHGIDQIPLDSQKVDVDYMRLSIQENNYERLLSEPPEIDKDKNANSKNISMDDIADAQIVGEPVPAQTPAQPAQQEKKESSKAENGENKSTEQLEAGF